MDAPRAERLVFMAAENARAFAEGRTMPHVRPWASPEEVDKFQQIYGGLSSNLTMSDEARQRMSISQKAAWARRKAQKLSESGALTAPA